MNRINFCFVLLGFALSIGAAASEPLDDARAAYVRGDFAAALAVLQPLALQGNAEAQYALGSLYGTGSGLRKDYAEAARWIRKSADQGFAKAQYDLGVMYRDGMGVSRDDVETVRWWQRAAEQGMVNAQHNLGLRYASGQGIAKDEAVAVEWFRRASQQEFAGSQFQLAVMYAEGRGVPRDLVEAYKWMSLAALNVEGSPRTIATGRRDQFAKSMTSAQIERAKQLACEWTPVGPDASPYRVLGSGLFAEGDGVPVAGGQRVDLGSYLVSAPVGDGWKMRADRSAGALLFVRSTPGGGLTTISVARRPLSPGMQCKSEHEIVEAIQRFEERNFKARGAVRAYAAEEIRSDTIKVGDKQLHSLTYTVTDVSQIRPLETKESTYIYLPQSVQDVRQVYFFGIVQPLRIGDAVFETDLTGILPVIASIQIQ